MRHGRLCAAGFALALAGLATAQPERLPGVTAAADDAHRQSTAGTAPVDTQATTLPAVVLPSDPARLSGPVTAFTAPGAGDAGQQFWFSAEYLWWTIRDQSLPPLVTTGPAQFPVGFLGSPGTVLLFGGTDHDQGSFSGVRLRAGAWLNPCRTLGIEASFFCLPEQTDRTTFSSNQFPVLTRPFTDVNTGSPNSEFLAFPGIATGSISIETKTQFCGGALTARSPVCVGCNTRLDAFGGLQYLNLREELTIVESPLFSPNAPFPGLAGTQFVATDRFRTRNQFYGGVIGLEGAYLTGPWMVTLAASVAFGDNHQTIKIRGTQQATTAAGTTTVVPGGLLALPGANIGNFSKDEFSVAPQVGLNIGYQITEHIQVFGGYTFLYWNRVVRPGDQIDPVLDVNRIPNFGTLPAAKTVRPAVPFNQTDFWAQGVSIGVAFSW